MKQHLSYRSEGRKKKKRKKGTNPSEVEKLIVTHRLSAVMTMCLITTHCGALSRRVTSEENIMFRRLYKGKETRGNCVWFSYT